RERSVVEVHRIGHVDHVGKGRPVDEGRSAADLAPGIGFRITRSHHGRQCGDRSARYTSTLQQPYVRLSASIGATGKKASEGNIGRSARRGRSAGWDGEALIERICPVGDVEVMLGNAGAGSGCV